jgi:hypothetical protein
MITAQEALNQSLEAQKKQVSEIDKNINIMSKSGHRYTILDAVISDKEFEQSIINDFESRGFTVKKTIFDKLEINW